MTVHPPHSSRSFLARASAAVSNGTQLVAQVQTSRSQPVSTRTRSRAQKPQKPTLPILPTLIELEYVLDVEDTPCLANQYIRTYAYPAYADLLTALWECERGLFIDLMRDPAEGRQRVMRAIRTGRAQAVSAGIVATPRQHLIDQMLEVSIPENRAVYGWIPETPQLCTDVELWTATYRLCANKYRIPHFIPWYNTALNILENSVSPYETLGNVGRDCP
jgi:hypothetical protein